MSQKISWVSNKIDIPAGVIFPVSCPSGINGVVIKNPDETNNINVDTDYNSIISKPDTTVMASSAGIFAQPSDIGILYLYCASSIQGVKLEMFDNTDIMAILGTIVKPPNSNVAVTSTVGLKTTDVLIDAQKHLQVDIVSQAALPAGSNLIGAVTIAGNVLQEQKTESDAVAGVLTFAANIQYIEIYNTDATNAGVFTANGINITVPAGKVFKSAIGGTAAATVSITGATTYIVSRYI